MGPAARQLSAVIIRNRSIGSLPACQAYPACELILCEVGFGRVHVAIERRHHQVR